MSEIRKQQAGSRATRPANSSGTTLSGWLKLIMASVAAGSVLTIYILLIKAMLVTTGNSDFLTLYLSGLRLRYDEPIYWLSPAANAPDGPCGLKMEDLPFFNVTGMTETDLARLKPCWHPNLNTPFMTALLAPLTYLDFPAARLLWLTLSALAVWLSLYLLGREGLLPKCWTLGFTALLAAFWGYFPSFITVLHGQVTFLVLLPLVLGWVMLRQGRNLAAGAWLGLAVSLKPFVGLFLLGLAAQCNWRACMGLLLACLVCFVLGGAAAGFDTYLVYRDILNHVNWQSASWNASLFGFFTRLFGGSENIPWHDAPRLAHGLSLAGSLTLLALYLRAVWDSRGWPLPAKADLLAAASIPAMLLISPLGWIYYFPLLLITITVLGARAGHGGDWRPWAYAVAMTLSGVPSWLIKSKDMNDPLDWFGAPAMYMFSLIFLFTMVVLGRRRVMAIRPEGLSNPVFQDGAI